MSEPQALYNILDFGGVRVGDTVEYVSMDRSHNRFEHGTTSVTYRCSAYVELSNGNVVDGALLYNMPATLIIVNGKAYPNVPTKDALKTVLKTLQHNGKPLAQPYHRVMSILGGACGLALDQSDGKWYYREVKHVKRPKYAGTTKERVTQIPCNLPAYSEGTGKRKYIQTWKQIARDEWFATRWRRGDTLEASTHWYDGVTDLREVISGLGIIDESEAR